VARTPPSLQVAPRSPEIYEAVIPAIDEAFIPPSMEAAPGVGPPLLEDLALDVGINNDVIDDIIYDQHHEEKVSDNYVAEGKDIPEQDLEELEHDKYGGGTAMRMERRQITIILHQRIVLLKTSMKTRWMVGTMMSVRIS
jgi:hypothetical protein